MALLDLFTSRLAGPAGRVLDAPIRDIVHEILREHGYASPAEVQALRDELRDLRTRVDGVDRRVTDLSAMAEGARSEAAAARAEAVARPAASDAGRTAALELRVSELEAALTVALTPAPAPVVITVPEAAAPTPSAPLSAEPRGACKVSDCGDAVRSKGFCSPHYQQWRRGTLKGFVNADGTALVDGRVVHFATEAIGADVASRGGVLYVDGKPTQEVSVS